MPDRIKQRFDRLLDAMLTKPPLERPSPPDFVVINDRLVVAEIKGKRNGTITADLYRNMEDYRQGTAMARDAKLAV